MPALPEIPQGKQWRGMFRGNYFGNLWASYNVDLEKTPGRIALANKLRRFSSGLGVVYKFVRTNASTTDQWFAMVYDTDILRNGNGTITAGTWVTDDVAGTFNDPRDMLVHENVNGEERLLCSRATNIAILNSAGVANAWDDDWWTAVVGGPALTSLNFHPLAKLQRLVAIGDKQTVGAVTSTPVIHTLDQNDVYSTSRLVFSSEYTVRHIISSSDRFWIALQHDRDGNAKIIEWDGFSLSYNKEYELVGSLPLTGFVVNDIPYFITEYGYIFKYSGGGFEKVADFCFQEQRAILNTNLDNSNTILPYGVYVENLLVYINVGAPVIGDTSDASSMNGGVRRARSGIWIFNTETGNLYHHMAYGEHATAGTDVNYGNGFIERPGAVVKATVGSDRIIVTSGNVYTGGGTWLAGSTNGIYREIDSNFFASDQGRNRGYFITPLIPIGEVEVLWEALWVKLRRFRITPGDTTSDDRIIVKWRTRDPLFEADATDPNTNENFLMNGNGLWASTTSFSGVVPIGVAVGDEVEILTGDNAGCSFNISALSATPDGAATITVTIDEAAPTSSTDRFLCRFDNWRSEPAITSTTVGSQRVPLTVSSTANSGTGQGEFIQFKIELRGFGTEIDGLIPFYKTKTSPSQT
jgi:hypothetical protein